jgi:hypothetical protein
LNAEPGCDLTTKSKEIKDVASGLGIQINKIGFAGARINLNA